MIKFAIIGANIIYIVKMKKIKPHQLMGFDLFIRAKTLYIEALHSPIAVRELPLAAEFALFAEMHL